MEEKIYVYGLRIPDVGYFMLTSPEALGSMLHLQKQLQHLFGNSQVSITLTPDYSRLYKEVRIENVWSEHIKDRPMAYKWSRNGLAMLFQGFWDLEGQREYERTSLLKILNS